jgi:hypothetical protein
MDLKYYVNKVAQNAVNEINLYGHSRPGFNGPYNDPETPVRNTAHALFLLSKLANDTKDSLIINAANKACDYLCGQSARPKNTIFYCRKNPKKDLSNGLIGQAWAIEGLIAAAKYLGRKDALRIAKECYYLHPWSESQSIWHRVALDGSAMSPDGTFNHQLWFAAVSSNFDDAEIIIRSERFLNNVAQHVQIYEDGVIYHQSRLGSLAKSLINKHSSILKSLYIELSRIKMRKYQYSKSVGYHSFNLYAFALLKKKFPDHKFWSSLKFIKILTISKSKVFLSSLNKSKYGWPYNPPGIEFAFVGQVFNLGQRYCQSWIDLQYFNTFNKMTGDLLTHGVPDPITSSLRIYEGLRLKNNYDIPAKL